MLSIKKTLLFYAFLLLIIPCALYSSETETALDSLRLDDPLASFEEDTTPYYTVQIDTLKDLITFIQGLQSSTIYRYFTWLHRTDKYYDFQVYELINIYTAALKAALGSKKDIPYGSHITDIFADEYETLNRIRQKIQITLTEKDIIIPPQVAGLEKIADTSPVQGMVGGTFKIAYDKTDTSKKVLIDTSQPFYISFMINPRTIIQMMEIY